MKSQTKDNAAGKTAAEIPLPRSETDGSEAGILDEWHLAQSGCAMALAQTSARFGAFDERIRRAPEGWRHRLAMIETAELSWFSGDRIAPDRLALWMALHVSGVQDDTRALARAGWAVRRLTGGAGPLDGLQAFLGRSDRKAQDDSLANRIESWQVMMTAATGLHPIAKAAMGFHLWALAGLSLDGNQIEAAVTAARIATIGDRGAGFMPLAIGGTRALQTGGTPRQRLQRWLEGLDASLLAADRHLDRIEAWTARAEAATSGMSGRTPMLLCRIVAAWPLVSAPMAEALAKISRAAAQRNLATMQDMGLLQEVTGQGRFRMWRAAL